MVTFVFPNQSTSPSLTPYRSFPMNGSTAQAPSQTVSLYASRYPPLYEEFCIKECPIFCKRSSRRYPVGASSSRISQKDHKLSFQDTPSQAGYDGFMGHQLGSSSTAQFQILRLGVHIPTHQSSLIRGSARLATDFSVWLGIVPLMICSATRIARRCA